MRIHFTLGSYDVTLTNRARCALTHCKLHTNEYSHHLVWWRFSLLIENHTVECHAVCKQCGASDISEVHAGDEGLTVCQSCQTIEGGYSYVNLRVYENASCT